MKKEKIIRRGDIEIKIMENEEGISISSNKEMLLINISDFKKDIPLETFADDVENQIKHNIEDGTDLSVTSVFHSLADKYAFLEGTGKITVLLDRGWNPDFKEFLKRYGKVLLTNREQTVSLEDGKITYSDSQADFHFYADGNFKTAFEKKPFDFARKLEEVRKMMF